MRIVFLGTPEAALPSLDAVRAIGDVGLVVTRPDRPRGRSSRPQPSPVKSAALDVGLPVAQPSSGPELVDALTAVGAIDVGVVVAFGMLIPPNALATARCGFVNLHFSVLPRWRGAAPVSRALMAGDRRTGVSVFRLDEGLDTGPLIGTRSWSLTDGEGAGDLTARLAHGGATFLQSILGDFVDGAIAPLPQSDHGATYAAKLGKADRFVDESETPDRVVARVRALAPTPAAVAVADGDPVKILKAASSTEEGHDRFFVVDGRPHLTVGGGSVELVEVQPAGKRPMAGSDWVRGWHGVVPR